MKFNSGSEKIKHLSPSLKEEIIQKLFSAEDNLVILRLFVVAVNTIVYLFLMNREHTIPLLAYSIIFIAWTYSVILYFFKPYRKFHFLNSIYFTSGTDALLIIFWIISTGGTHSPFYVLWYVSIIAVALRYTFKVTMATAVLYCAAYLVLFLIDNSFANQLAEMVTRCSYILLIAMGSGLLSKEAVDQIEDKLLIKHSQQEIQKQQELLKEINEKLEERVKERTLELKEKNQELMRINEDIDNFVYAASHDLKAPILNIKALLTLLYEKQMVDVEDEDSNEIKEKINVGIERVLTTINHLSNIAKAQEIQEDIDFISFEEILKEVIADNEQILKRSQADIIQDFKDANSINFSRIGLKSIIHNFLNNAVKYKSPDRSPVITIKTEKTDKHIILSIKDNGLGMDLTRYGNKLFSLFKRFHTHVEGAGIGLYMVKRIVDRSKSQIEVESEVDKGTTFKIKFIKGSSNQSKGNSIRPENRTL
jgi:signal transduction histidine kinase